MAQEKKAASKASQPAQPAEPRKPSPPAQPHPDSDPSSKVQSGSQGPETRVVKQPAEERNLPPVNLNKLDESTVVFQSRYANHRVQLTRAKKVPDTDPPQWDRGLTLQFEAGLAQVETDPDLNPEGERTVKLARRHSAFGLDFWDAREAQKKADAKEAEQAAATIEKLVTEKPEYARQLLEKLSRKEGGDAKKFELPAREEK